MTLIEYKKGEFIRKNHIVMVIRRDDNLYIRRKSGAEMLVDKAYHPIVLEHFQIDEQSARNARVIAMLENIEKVADLIISRSPVSNIPDEDLRFMLAILAKPSELYYNYDKPYILECDDDGQYRTCLSFFDNYSGRFEWFGREELKGWAITREARNEDGSYEVVNVYPSDSIKAPHIPF